jgi:hypothetical protein
VHPKSQGVLHKMSCAKFLSMPILFCALGLLLTLPTIIYLPGCSRMGARTSSAELFRLRAECANQASRFDAHWRRRNESDFQVLIFQNHYNQAQGRCFVGYSIFYGHTSLNTEAVYDTLEGLDKPPLVLLVRGEDKAPSQAEKNRELAARIRSYMED